MRVLGLDVGIASVGWGLIDIFEPGCGTSRVVAAGVWIFEPPEDKTQSGTKLRSEARRLFRGQRRVIRRRRQRMAEVRDLLMRHGLLASCGRDALRAPECDPWSLRTAALKRALTPLELGVALGHIARHRGFKSNAKGAARNDADGDMLKAVAKTKDTLALFATPALALMEDEAFVLRATKRRDGVVDTVRRLRNREGDYSRSLLRGDLEAEVRAIIAAQRRFGMAQATVALEREFLDKAFFQRPLRDSEGMVGPCPFVPAEKRTARRGLSFERFRYLSRLGNLRLTGREAVGLSKEEIAKASADFGATMTISFSNLRRKLGLGAGILFEGVKPEEEGKRDVVARTGGAAAGTASLRKLIAGAHGEMAWLGLAETRPAVLDRVAEVLSFRNDLDRIREGLSETALEPEIQTTLLDAAACGALDVFAGAGHISAKAARNILPGLRDGMTYDKACTAVGYDHTASRERHAFETGTDGKEALAILIKGERISRELVGSPTARKALIEALKQVKAIVEEHGLPDRIHVELSRDVGKSIEEREEIERGIEKRNRQKEKLFLKFAEAVGKDPTIWRPSANDMLKYELWEEQGGRCLYSDTYISPPRLLAGDDSVQVDHILPWSRFGDDSFHNKTLCIPKANQDKRNRTVFEWLGKDPVAWEAFVARVKAVPYMKGMKRRNYLLQNADEAAERFKNRNLNDTRWSCRLLAEALRQVLPELATGKRNAKGEEIKLRRVFARPGALTDRLRRAWGLQSVKKDADGKRIPDDRHHALDALIVAAITESLLNRATREVQEIEAKGLHYDLTKKLSPPWPGFREDVLETVDKIFVARAPRARARGKAHDATIHQIGEKDGKEIVYERKRVADLKIADLTRIKDLERNGALAESLKHWIEAGKPKDRQPLSPKGDPIGKVRLVSKGKVAIRLYRGGPDNPAGAVDQHKMPRVDVYAKSSKRGVREYFLVPVYPHEIATLDAPPNRAVASGEAEWPVMDETYEFLWSIVPMTLLRVVRKNKRALFLDQADGNLAYFRNFDINTGAIILSSVSDKTIIKKGIGARTLHTLQKLTVDRLGRTFDVGQETLSWHGKACI